MKSIQFINIGLFTTQNKLKNENNSHNIHVMESHVL